MQQSCPTTNIHIHEHFKTFPEESPLPDTLPPLNGTNPWLDYKAHHTEACMHGTSAVSIILVTIYMFMVEMGFHLVHISFLDAAAKYSVVCFFGDSLPPTLISQRARSIAVSTNSCVIGGDLPKLTT